MKVCLIYDGSNATALSESLLEGFSEKFRCAGALIREFRLQKGQLAHCIGCFGCWVKNPGACVQKDSMDEINRAYMNSDIVIYLSPIIFGGFSSQIKNALDRSMPNISPFFTTQKGLTLHKARYPKYPVVLLIGYGDFIPAQDKETFTAWATNHHIGRKAYICSSAKDRDAIISQIASLTERQGAL